MGVEVRNRPQSYATVRVRAIWPCLWLVLQKGHFLRFQRRVASFRLAGVTLRDIQTCASYRVEKRFVRQAQYFCDVFRRCVDFLWQAQHFGDHHRHFVQNAQHFGRVVLRAFSNR